MIAIDTNSSLEEFSLLTDIHISAMRKGKTAMHGSELLRTRVFFFAEGRALVLARRTRTFFYCCITSITQIKRRNDLYTDEDR